MEILRVEKLCKVYGERETAVKALQDVSFSMKKGEFAAVIGESGSGKSTYANVWQHLSGWNESLWDERRREDLVSPAKGGVYLSIVSTDCRTKCRTKYYVSTFVRPSKAKERTSR